MKLESEYDDLDKYKNNINDNVWYCKKGTMIWHNPYGPACISDDGSKYYLIEDKYHRLDGPAIIWPDGEEEYYINSEKLSKEEFECHPERLKFLGKEHLICLT